jgi:hypothetical protein
MTLKNIQLLSFTILLLITGALSGAAQTYANPGNYYDYFRIGNPDSKTVLKSNQNKHTEVVPLETWMVSAADWNVEKNGSQENRFFFSEDIKNMCAEIGITKDFLLMFSTVIFLMFIW